MSCVFKIHFNIVGFELPTAVMCYCLLAYGTVDSGKEVSTFRRNMLPIPSALKMKAAGSFEILVTFRLPKSHIRRHILLFNIFLRSMSRSPNWFSSHNVSRLNSFYVILISSLSYAFLAPLLDSYREKYAKYEVHHYEVFLLSLVTSSVVPSISIILSTVHRQQYPYFFFSVRAQNFHTWKARGKIRILYILIFHVLRWIMER